MYIQNYSIYNKISHYNRLIMDNYPIEQTRTYNILKMNQRIKLIFYMRPVSMFKKSMDNFKIFRKK